MKTILKYEDGGHGWYAVEKDYVKLLGISEKVSGYSYEKDGLAYLEEDCDASLLLDAMEAKGYEYVIERIYQKGNSPIRGYRSFRA